MNDYLDSLLVLGVFSSTIFTALTFAYYKGQRSISRSECYRLGKDEGIEICIQRARIAVAMGKNLDTQSVQNEIKWI